MIVFELRCGNDHHFEAWFKDGATYETQAAAGEIGCPQCGDVKIIKAIMAPRLNTSASPTSLAIDPVKMRQALGALRQSVETNCENVGDRFPEEARRIHYGETAARGIYGEASTEQAQELKEEGIAVARIPWVPKAD